MHSLIWANANVEIFFSIEYANIEIFKQEKYFSYFHDYNFFEIHGIVMLSIFKFKLILCVLLFSLYVHLYLCTMCVHVCLVPEEGTESTDSFEPLYVGCEN